MNQPKSNLLARDVMMPRKRLVTLSPAMDALSAIRMLLKHRISGAPVVDEDNRYLGVFSEKTSMEFLLHLTYEDLPSSDVGSFMNTDLDRTIDEEADLLSVLDIFLKSPYRRLPVVNQGFLRGQISRRDALGAATKSLEQVEPIQQRQLLYLSAFGQQREDISARF